MRANFTNLYIYYRKVSWNHKVFDTQYHKTMLSTALKMYYLSRMCSFMVRYKNKFNFVKIFYNFTIVVRM